MAYVIWRSDSANLAHAVAGHSTGMTAIKNCDKPGLIWQVNIKMIKIVVSNCRLLRPREVIGYQTLICVVYLADRIVEGELRSMSAVKQNSFHPIFGALQQPIQPLSNRVGGCSIVQNDPYVFRIKSALLKQGTHQNCVIDTAVKLLRRIRVI